MMLLGKKKIKKKERKEKTVSHRRSELVFAPMILMVEQFRHQIKTKTKGAPGSGAEKGV